MSLVVGLCQSKRLVFATPDSVTSFFGPSGLRVASRKYRVANTSRLDWHRPTTSDTVAKANRSFRRCDSCEYRPRYPRAGTLHSRHNRHHAALGTQSTIKLYRYSLQVHNKLVESTRKKEWNVYKPACNFQSLFLQCTRMLKGSKYIPIFSKSLSKI